MDKHRDRYVTPTWQLAGRRWLTPAIAFLALMTFGCGLSGFIEQYSATLERQRAQAVEDAESTGNPPASVEADWTIPFYKAIQLFLLDSGTDDDTDHPTNWLLSIARVSAALLFLIVSFAVISRVLKGVRELPRIARQTDHVVICGLGRIGRQLLDDLHDAGRIHKVVVIDNSSDEARRKHVRSLGAAVLVGDATEPDILREARIQRASEVFAVTGCDGANLEIAAEVNLLLHKHGRQKQPLKFYGHIVDVSLAGTLRSYCAEAG